MAIHFTDPKATFIHIPKTGGSSFEKWCYSNLTSFERKDKHSNLKTANDTWDDLGFVFTIVRNPFARYVSMYHFIGQRAIRRIERRANGLKVKKSTNQNDDLKIIELYNKGFDYWLNCMYNKDEEFIDIPNGDWSRSDSQFNWIAEGKVDLLLKTENLKNDFKAIQSMFNIDAELPHTNKSRHSHYRDYYNNTTKNIIQELSKKDLEEFNYEF